mmetsp:Transcript_2453/g.4112  ORF Transcript_2453/g.4112 Transcript_2453/m.4112 type:complete len:260 (-) Transcript_2453:690-1469(-)|eukprot:CAMPEP_0119105150 /NCGR_PEP_ID=MMETSP1180-20130426/3194_1 /TAXON_ID=3052 ORGANISM="Chlamydomonas cf sp, Strain CCMP681" /NCGR_SAMPLE_ID=MMETSP1180 /ASSEMBLY_ACC=CAM_ASM_000741 /LENGTH=259 /DNA_ID=CAMNT_0007090135 /DNA_START=229 /DNA_END=1008 /DNA_ORIENTATION=-
MSNLPAPPSPGQGPRSTTLHQPCSEDEALNAADRMHLYDVHITWHLSWQAPVLLLRGRSSDGALLDWPSVEDDFPWWADCRAQAGAAWAFITPEAHPRLSGAQARGWYMAHPCNTAEVMKLLRSSTPPPWPTAQLHLASGTRRLVCGAQPQGQLELMGQVVQLTEEIPDIDSVAEPCASVPSRGIAVYTVEGQEASISCFDRSVRQEGTGSATLQGGEQDSMCQMCAWFLAVAAPVLGLQLNPMTVAQVLRQLRILGSH